MPEIWCDVIYALLNARVMLRSQSKIVPQGFYTKKEETLTKELRLRKSENFNLRDFLMV